MNKNTIPQHYNMWKDLCKPILTCWKVTNGNNMRVAQKVEVELSDKLEQASNFMVEMPILHLWISGSSVQFQILTPTCCTGIFREAEAMTQVTGIPPPWMRQIEFLATGFSFNHYGHLGSEPFDEWAFPLLCIPAFILLYISASQKKKKLFGMQKIFMHHLPEKSFINKKQMCKIKSYAMILKN